MARRYEDVKGIVAPKIDTKSFGTFEKEPLETGFPGAWKFHLSTFTLLHPIDNMKKEKNEYAT